MSRRTVREFLIAHIHEDTEAGRMLRHPVIGRVVIESPTGAQFIRALFGFSVKCPRHGAFGGRLGKRRSREIFNAHRACAH